VSAPDDTAATAARFSRGADAYLRLWAPVLRPHAVRLVEALPIAGAGRVLEVGAGVGALLPEIARAAPRARVFGSDVATGMLALAPKEFPVSAMDAARLALHTASLDAVVMAFMLFLVPAAAAALEEVRRVLRPGGVLGIVTWLGQPMFPAQEIWEEEIGSLSGSPVPRWPTITSSEDELSSLVSAAELAIVRCWSESFLYRSDLDGFLDLRLGLGRIWLEPLTPDARQAFVERVRRRLQRLPPEGFANRATVLHAIARAPAR